MIAAAKWAREKKIPYLGICLGFQIAVIEFARNVLGLEGKFSLSTSHQVKNPGIGTDLISNASGTSI